MLTEHPIHLMLNPGSVSICGASNNPMKMGTMQAISIFKDGYKGNFYLVHPTEPEVLGYKAYRSPLDLPEAPDLAIFIVPTNVVIPLFKEYAQRGTKRAVIITAGFKEMSGDGVARERELLEIAKKHGVRIIGPNCMGILNTHMPFNMTVLPFKGKPGSLGLASQSGTYVTQSLSYLRHRGIAFSKAISVGNEADLNIIDVMEYLGGDEQTRAIALYIEGIRDGRRFLEVARKITPHKPIVAQYVGGSEAGARSGKSHTGAMAGPAYLYSGIFKQAGIIQVNTVEDLYRYGWALATQAPLKGNRLGIVTNSGGPGTTIANTCNVGGMKVPAFSAALQAKARKLIAPHASSVNPIDLTFHMDASRITTTLPELVMASGEVDGVIIHGAMNSGMSIEKYDHIKSWLGGISFDDFIKQSEKDMSEAVSLPRKYNMPLLVSSFFGDEDDFTRAYHDNQIPIYDAPEKAANAMLTLYKHLLVRGRKPIGKPKLIKRSEQASDLIKVAKLAGQKAMDEHQSKVILSAYGIPITREKVVYSVSHAREAATKLKFPVAVKACSHEILHKTGKGLIYLGMKNEREVVDAFKAIRKAAGKEIGILIQEMIKGDRELIAGTAGFPGFPSCVLFGLGGVLAEVLKDNSIRSAPLTKTEAEEMIFDIKTKDMLGDYRGMKKINAKTLADLLVVLGQLPLLHPEIAEMDLNPIIIKGADPVVVDALIVFK